MYKKGCSKTIGFVVILQHETTLWFCGMVSFQTLVVKHQDSYTYKEGCSQTIVFVMFLWDETTLFIFEMVSC